MRCERPLGPSCRDVTGEIDLGRGKKDVARKGQAKRAPTCAESVILFQGGRTMLPSPLSDSTVRRPRSRAPLALARSLASATIFPPSLPQGPCIVCEICGAVRSPHHEFRDCRLRFGRISRADYGGSDSSGERESSWIPSDASLHFSQRERERMR